MEDISRSTVAVLLVLTVVISVIGTWTVVEVAGGSNPAMAGQPMDGGQINFDYMKNPANKEPKIDSGSGTIGFDYGK